MSRLGRLIGVGLLVGGSYYALRQMTPVPSKAGGFSYPRLWNDGSAISSAVAPTMARWDVWGMGGDIEKNADGTINISAFKADLQLVYNYNPNMKFLVYWDSIIDETWRNYGFGAIPEAYYAHDSLGNRVPLDTSYLMNCSDLCPVVNGKTWVQACAQKVHDLYWANAAGNGFQADDMDGQIAWRYHDLDLDNDGVNDYTASGQGKSWIDQHWLAGLLSLYQALRNLCGSTAIITGNGNAGSQALGANTPYANGRANEGWNGVPVGNWPDWSGALADYMSWDAHHYGDNYFSTQPAGRGISMTDYQSFRFYLTTILLGDGLLAWYPGWNRYYWFDEYSVNLSTGQATGDATGKGYLGQPLGPYEVLASGVYRRDYSNGIALCNPTGSAQTVNLGQSYRKISGTQDPATNDGQTVTSVTISAGNTAAGLVGDGVILLR